MIPTREASSSSSSHNKQGSVPIRHCKDEYELGSRYRDGDGVPKDPQRAFNAFKQAAGRNNINTIRAKYELGCCYRDGIGVAKDLKGSI